MLLKLDSAISRLNPRRPGRPCRSRLHPFVTALLSDDGEKDSCVAALTVRAGPDLGSSGFA
jgi:hypothetical protein